MADPFIGEIRLFSFNFAPAGWALCNGQLLSIVQNQALFVLIGTTYGGDGITTYALPNLQGRTVIHQGDGYVIGQAGGAAEQTLTVGQLPRHGHVLAADDNAANSTIPGGNFPARTGLFSAAYGHTANAAMNPGAIGLTGEGQPINTLPPYLVLNWCIALFGVFPSQQ